MNTGGGTRAEQRQNENPGTQEINALVALFNEGRFTEAANLAQSMTERFPLNWIGWKMLGVVFQQLGRYEDALVPMRKAADLLPQDAEAHNNLGITLQNLDHLAEAEASYRRALQIRPDYAQAHSNLGSTLQGMNRLSEAEASYRRALLIDPDYAKAHCNLGAILQYLGRLDEAEASLRRALEIWPDYVDAHNNQGAVLQDQGRIAEAEASYRRALELKPDSTDTLNNLASLFNMQGKSMVALNVIKQSLQVKETAEAKSAFVACAKHLRFTQDDDATRSAMVCALAEPWGRPSELVQAAISLVRLDPDIAECVARAVDAWPQRLAAQELFGTNGRAALAADALLRALLDAAPICDIEMERFLTMARHVLLEAAVTATGSEAGNALSFYSALARQCFINEYVFACSDAEIEKANDLRDSLAAALEADTPVPALWPVAIAAYFPLGFLPLSARLLQRQWPDEVAAVLKQQILEPAEEQQLRATIPHLTGIGDGVSLLVQKQYEENPYPRWVKTAPAAAAKNLAAYLHQKFPLASFKCDYSLACPSSTSGNIDVLVAGCGTGQHPIGTAQRIQGARILAIDLSMTSLGYAKRKTRELGITSIEYAQADLLKLGSLGRSFDVIESVGVLHHLADPWAGWQVLLSLLRPGGYMKLGLYSAAARRNIARARNFIAGQNYGETASEIRQCRQDLIDLNNSEDFATTIKSPDFFSISACRDLLFHVQEQRMTLAEIDAFLQKNKQSFLGFEIDADVLYAFKRRFPDDRAAVDLERWEIFEGENPDTFSGMYQFWIQKPD